MEAPTITPDALDHLEKDPGYLTWALRLAPYVNGDDPISRARRHQHAANAEVRYWANKVLGHGR